MPDIEIELCGTWPSRPATLPSTMTISKADLLKSAAIVGAPLMVSTPYCRRPIVEFLWRQLMIEANLVTSLNGNGWERSPAYNRLDPSEKTAVSYFLGMTMSHLASQHLGYSHLVHVDALLISAGQKLIGSRPDFLAADITPSGSLVYVSTWEAKGRTHEFDKKALAKAKSQATKVPSILKTPIESIGCVAYFDDKTGLWAAKLEDPQWNGTLLDLTLEDYLLAYYEPLVQVSIESETRESTEDLTVFNIPTFPARIALPRKIEEAVIESRQLNESDRNATQPIISAFIEATEDLDSALPRDLVVVISDDDAIDPLLLDIEKGTS